ncbi:unnamed protein product [Rhizophagus irregularis]|nr:unnamed protein product [Rhizophagus irregularis]
MAQQVSTPQTVESVRQPKCPPSSLKTEKGLKNYYVAEYLKEIGLLNKEDLDSDYPVKPFQRPRSQRSNNSARFDRIEEGLDKTRDAVNQLTNQFQKLNIHKCDICGETGHSKGSYPKRQIARSNFNRSYFKPLTPINFQNTPPDSDEENGDNNEEENRWYDLPLSPAMRKMCLSRKAQKEKSKKDEWFSSLQYLNASINDLPISEYFLDDGSGFDGFNLATAEELGWKVDKPSKFAVKGNSEHIFEALGWYTNVAVTLKDIEGNPIITIVENYACVDNGKPKPMLWLGMIGIRKVKGISDPTKNQFRIEDHGKTYIIPTFSKAPVVKDLPKEEQDQASANFSSLTGDRDLKKVCKLHEL